MLAEAAVRYRLTTKFAIPAGIVLLATMVLFAFLNINFLKKLCLQEAIKDADNLGETILRTTYHQMLNNDRVRMYEMIEEVNEQQGIENIRLLDKDGVITFSTDKREIGMTVDSKAEGCSGCHVASTPLTGAPSSARSRIFVNALGEEVLGVTKEINNNKSCYTARCHFHPEEANLLGVLDVHVSLNGMYSKLSDSRKTIVFFALALLSILSFCLFILIQRLINRPVDNLLQHTKQLTCGQFESRVPRLGNDELGELGRAFNDMAANLQQAHDELTDWGTTLETKVEERTRELEQMQTQLIQSAKLASLGELVAGIAHEINNPLTAILMFSSLVSRDKRLDEALRPNLDTVIEETKRCAKIVQDLLDFSRHSPPEKKTCSLHRLIDQTLDITAGSLGEIEVVRNYAENIPELTVDAEQLEQVFMNLIINAGQAMPAGGSLMITTAREGEDRVVIEFADTGEGMSKDVLDKIFDPFFTTKERGQGTGLGLSISYGIIKNHDGEIGAKSVPGQGTSFRITLPLNHQPRQ